MMKVALEQEKELLSAEKSRKIFLFAFSAATILYLVGLFLLVFFSGDTYWPQLFILLGITIVYIWFAIFCFSAAFPAQNKRIHFLRQSLEGPYEERIVTFLGKEDSQVEKEGLWATICRGGYQEKGKDFDWEFYLPGEAPKIEEGTKLRIKSYHRVVLSYEVVS